MFVSNSNKLVLDAKLYLICTKTKENAKLLLGLAYFKIWVQHILNDMPTRYNTCGVELLSNLMENIAILRKIV